MEHVYGARQATARAALAVAFIDFIDASITNIALPHINHALHVSVQNLQWIPSAYLLTYGGLMLLGGRLATTCWPQAASSSTGTPLIGPASLTGGLAQSPGMLIAARIVQGAAARDDAPGRPLPP